MKSYIEGEKKRKEYASWGRHAQNIISSAEDTGDTD